jgi:hypothetical protein
MGVETGAGGEGGTPARGRGGAMRSDDDQRVGTATEQQINSCLNKCLDIVEGADRPENQKTRPKLMGCNGKFPWLAR